MNRSRYPELTIGAMSLLAIVVLAISFLVIRPVTPDNYCAELISKFSVEPTALNIQFLSSASGIIMILLNAVTIWLMCRSFSQTRLLSVQFYLILVLSNPQSISLTALHIATFIFSCGMLFFILTLDDKRPNMDSIIMAFILFATSTLFFPPLIWAIPVLAAISLIVTDAKGRKMFGIILGTLTPFAIYIAVFYLVNGWQGLDLQIGAFLSSMVDTPSHTLVYAASTAIKLLIVSIATIIAIVSILKNINRLDKSSFAVMTSVIVCLITCFIIICIFFKNCTYPYGILLFIPVSILLSGSVPSWNNTENYSLIYLMFLLVLLAERLSIILQ